MNVITDKKKLKRGIVGNVLEAVLSPLKINDKQKATDGRCQQTNANMAEYLDPIVPPLVKPKPSRFCICNMNKMFYLKLL